jgi:glycerol uptake facilitator-like aquaporin
MTTFRRLAAEAIGTAGLLVIVVGSGIMAAELSAGNAGIALLANAIATGLGLFVLISVFAPLSGAHFNPIVSTMALCDRNLNPSMFVAYVTVQICAAVFGTWVAHVMFESEVFQLGLQRRAGVGQLFSESVATFGLVMTIRGTADRNPSFVAAAVGAYIAAAYWFTASTSFANPAVTLARSLTTTFAGIAPQDILPFIGAQILGGTVGYLVSQLLWDWRPRPELNRRPTA